MSTLIDSCSLESKLNLELESEEEEDPDKMIDFEEIRAHAGTGGSSKLKTRPA